MTTEIYSKDDLVAAKTRNKKTWTFFFTTTAVFLVGLAAGLLAFFRQTPDAPMRIPLLVADCVLAAIYAAFTVLYFIVNVGAAKKYAAFLEGVLNADPEKSTVNFMRIGEETELLDGVELRPFFALEWSDELEDYKDVKFYLDELKPLPPFKCGDIIEVAAYNGIMTGYAITAPAPAEESENEADSFSAEENIQSV